VTFLTVKDALARIPVQINEQRFRTTARRLKLNKLDGRQMMVDEDDIPKIVEGMTWRFGSSGGNKRRASRGRGSSVGMAESDIEKALKLAIGR
jgi:hypothetical protein